MAPGTTFAAVPDPRATLQSAFRLLAPKGRVLIRMPIMGQEAWRRYGVNWVQIDPPRLLAVYTLDAVHRLAAEEGFEVDNIYFDSKAFQFWGSELALRKQPFASDAPTKVFSEDQMLAWAREGSWTLRLVAPDPEKSKGSTWRGRLTQQRFSAMKVRRRWVVQAMSRTASMTWASVRAQAVPTTAAVVAATHDVTKESLRRGMRSWMDRPPPGGSLYVNARVLATS